MIALFIGSDPALATAGSAARMRMQSYAAAIGTLYIVTRAPHSFEVKEGNLVIRGVGGGKLFGLVAMLFAARRIIRKQAIEVVSAQDPFEYGWVAAQAVRGTHARLHIQIHTDFCSPWFTRGGVMRSAQVRMPLLNTLRQRIADRVLPQADGIRVVSKRIQDSLTARYGERLASIAVIPIAVNPELPEPIPFPEHVFSFALVTVARLEPEKRVEDIIDAIARIHRQYPFLGLFVMGEGQSRKRLERHARALGLGEHIVFLGWRTDARALMRSAQAYIQASAYEGYGLSLIEAALARLPIITTDVGIVGEVFVGYEDVLVAPPGDPAALAVHIASLIEDVQARKALVMHAEQKVQEHLAAQGNQPIQIAADLARTVAPL